MGAREPPSLNRGGARRKRLDGVALGLLLTAIGCNSPLAPAQSERWGRAWIDSLNSHRIQQVTPLLDPAATYQDPLTGKALSGAALAYFFALQWQAAPESRYTVRSVNGNRQFLAVEWSATGLLGRTAANPLEGVFLIYFSDELIGTVRGYYGTAALASSTR